MFGLEARILEIERRLKDILKDIRDALARIARLENNQWNQTAGSGPGGGGGSGAFYADHLGIGANSSITGVTVKRSWDGTNDTTSGKVWNILPDATTNTKRQLMVKNPDNTYTVVAESCSNS